MTENLKDLFEDELKDLYHAEQQILKALPKLIKAARSDELRDALQAHLDETEEQKTRLEKIFSDLGLPAKGKPCAGMQGILKEGDEMVAEAGDAVIDAAIIAAAQKVEHYEWASYGTVKAYAKMLGHDEAVMLLSQTLDEEQAADQKLTELAEAYANERAEKGEGEEEEDEGHRARGRSGEEDEVSEGEEETSRPSRGRSRTTAGVTSSSTSTASRRRDREGKASRPER